jgi:hypothetical protein
MKMQQWERENKAVEGKRHSRRRLICLLVGLALVIALVSLVAARYVTRRTGAYQAVQSTEFYFSTNLNSDPMMARCDEDDETLFSYPDQILTQTWDVYGGGDHVISLQVCNYLDELRVTQEEIPYTINVRAEKPTDQSGTAYEEVSVGDWLEIYPDTSEQATNPNRYRSKARSANGSDVYILPGGDQEGIQYLHRWNLDIRESSPVQRASTDASHVLAYLEGYRVIVTLQSISPYQETIELIFVLHTKEPTLSYRVEDQETYYELTIMAEYDTDQMDLVVHWPYETQEAGSTQAVQGVRIDNTNPLTFVTEPGNGSTNLRQMELIPVIDSSGAQIGYEMTLSRSLKAGESVSIYFFKDPGSDALDHEVPTASKVAIGTSANGHTLYVTRKNKS